MQSRRPATPAEVALQQAYRALELADRDRRASAEREQALADEIRALRKLIDDRLMPQIVQLEHANADLRHRCREAERGGRGATT